MRDGKPLVSVILPTYNRGYIIERAIRSVLNQTYSNIELIVIDDNSNDNTETIVKSICDCRIVYLKHNTNKGGGAARNTGIKKAKGDFIAFQDSDDEWILNKLEKQMNIFREVDEEIGVIYTGFTRYENELEYYIPSSQLNRDEIRGDIRNKILEGNFITTQATVVRKECFIKAGMFDEALPRLQDWELWIRISKFYKFELVDESLVNVYHSINSITADYNALIKAIDIILKKHNISLKDENILDKYSTWLAWEVSLGAEILNKYNLLLNKLPSVLTLKVSSKLVNNIINSYNLKLFNSQNHIENLEGTLAKYKVYYKIMNRWLQNKEYIVKYFIDKNINKIAIYGFGELGKNLYRELKTSSIEVRYIIDKENKEEDNSIPNVHTLTINEMNMIQDIDAIVVTPIYDFNSILDELNTHKINSMIISLEDVLIH